MRTLVFVHGRAQEHKDADVLKRAWVDALHEGFGRAGIDAEVPETSIRFPYYGQALFDLLAGKPEDVAAQVIVRGKGVPPQEEELTREILSEVIQQSGITDDQVLAAGGQDVIGKGPLNWEWVQAGLQAIDRFIPGASGTIIALVTKDVSQYLRNPGIRDVIEAGVRGAMVSDQEAVVVSHSLGTVVAFNLLRREGEQQGWRVPIFVTLGSPLGILAIRRSLQPLNHPSVVSRWFNAYDEGDVVSLYPLDETRFGVQPPVENWNGVKNSTPNHHGISGYLGDATVASRIHEALFA